MPHQHDEQVTVGPINDYIDLWECISSEKKFSAYEKVERVI